MSGLFMTKRLRNDLAQKSPHETEATPYARQWLKSRGKKKGKKIEARYRVQVQM